MKWPGGRRGIGFAAGPPRPTQSSYLSIFLSTNPSSQSYLVLFVSLPLSLSNFKLDTTSRLHDRANKNATRENACVRRQAKHLKTITCEPQIAEARRATSQNTSPVQRTARNQIPPGPFLQQEPFCYKSKTSESSLALLLPPVSAKAIVSQCGKGIFVKQ